MAPLNSTPKKRIRPSVRSRNRDRTGPDSGPPQKKLKYIPGGPGGGGRYVDPDTGQETPVGGTGPGGYNYTGPRGRSGRTNAERGSRRASSPPATSTRPRRERPRHPAISTGPRSSSATAAAAATQNDGYKPREERGWEEFHPDLDIETPFLVFSADEVDGVMSPGINPVTPGYGVSETGGLLVLDDGALPETPSLLTQGSSGLILDGDTVSVGGSGSNFLTPPKRRPGRPARRLDSMLTGLGSPPAPRIVPIPTHNPKERLNLQKPIYRQVDTFSAYEQDESVQVNYVDRTMANVGYQESDIFVRTDKTLIRLAEGSFDEDLDLALALKVDGEAPSGAAAVGRVEYDMDEQDNRWLDAYNAQRKEEQVEAIKPAIFEITMTQIEKEWHALEKRIPKPNPKPPQTHRPRSSSAAAVNGEALMAGEEQDTKCAICDDGDCENTNAIVFCDGCDLAVHQECYGVPFIPEGQWLCRKCQLIGRGTPTCIFCPNVDGAFKQTNSLRWSHLLCAIWIPEVTLGNTTFMEPVMDVEKVPKQRWKLTCYICNQKMGACIQCGNKNCFTAFHVTCARRAKLFLQMKSSHGTTYSMDASVLKAFCDRHVPSDWRKRNDVEYATAEAKAFYRHTMRGRRWADSQQSALARTSSQSTYIADSVEDTIGLGESGNPPANKRKRGEVEKKIWRLPSGAPIVPQAVFHNVENALIRFGVRKRKEYVAEACKYWTLKREARRGAALLKRLQLQMDTFTSMELTRRDFAAMGAAGRPKLHARIEFAERLEDDMEQIRVLCEKVKEREAEKRNDALLLKAIIDIVYFPIPPLLSPILERAIHLDSKGVFADGFKDVQTKLDERYYTSVSAFSNDIASVFSLAIGLNPNMDSKDAQQLIDGELSHNALTSEQKDKKKLAKRIIKAIQGPLEDATRKESELACRPFEKELANLDALLDRSMRAQLRPGSSDMNGINGGFAESNDLVQIKTVDSTTRYLSKGQSGETPLTNGIEKNHEQIVTKVEEKDEVTDDAVIRLHVGPGQTIPIPNHTLHINGKEEHGPGSSTGSVAPELSNGNSSIPSLTHPEPSTPPKSEEDLLAPLSNGGIPWYMTSFDPIGTTIHDEEWSGQEEARDMSEELSEIDDEELNGLADQDMLDPPPLDIALVVSTATATPKTVRKSRRRYRGFK